jgi:hypothetical protein
MAPKYPKGKVQTGRVGEAGLFLVSDRTLVGVGKPSTTRSEASVRTARSHRSRKTRGKRRPEAQGLAHALQRE